MNIWRVAHRVSPARRPSDLRCQRGRPSSVPPGVVMPAIKSILIEKPDPEGPMGAKGLGEHVLIPTAPAILNAIRHATGAKVTKVPALPHRVLAAIKAIQ